MLVLIDQDGVLADYERGFYEKWTTAFPDELVIEIADRRTFYLRQNYPVYLHEKLDAVRNAPGFFRNLPPVEGALEAVSEIVAAGYDVRICTSPIDQYENCVLEKYEWVERHLGREFTKRVILTKDKTIVHGDFLIDDKPLIEGYRQPAWRQVVFDAPYNRDSTAGIRLTDWKNWREALRLT